MPKFEPIGMTADVNWIEAEAVGDDDSPNVKKFSINAYNGGPLQVSRWDYPVVVDLAGMSAAKSVVANMDHDPSQIIGHSTSVVNDGKRVSIDGVLSGVGDHVDRMLAMSANGFPWQASIEAMPTKKPDFVGEGEVVEVNGQKIKGPVQIARKSKLYGIAFVARGADEQTSVKIAASAGETNKELDVNFEQWIEAQGFAAADLSDQQKAAMRKLYDAEIKASAGDPAKIEAAAFDLDDIKASADEHSAELDVILAEHEDAVPAKKFAEVKAAALKGARDLRKKAIAERWTAGQYAVEAVNARAKVQVELVRAERPTGPAIHSGRRAVDGAVIEAALATTAGVIEEKDYKPEVLEAAHQTFRGRLGVQQLLIMAAAQNGYVLQPGERINDGNLRHVLRHAFMEPVHASGFTTLSLSGILGNVLNKSLLMGYMQDDQTWREISGIKSVSDFKQGTSYRLLDSMSYEQVGPDGQIKHGALSEESYTTQAKTYAKMVAITRTDIINDDLRAFDDLAPRLGRGAAQKFNDVFWTAFMAQLGTMFTSARTNYISGSTTNLGTDGVGLSLGLKAFRQMKSGSADGSKRIGGRPEILLVPPDIEGNADILYQNGNLGAVSGATANIHYNKYRPVVSAWLSDSNFTGYSATHWFLLRSPSIAPAMMVSFLNGQQTPTVESADADFNTLGVQFRGYHDFGCDAADYLCGVMSKGAA